MGIKLARGEKAAAFVCDGEMIGFCVTEGTRREKHVLTEKELAEEEAARKRRTRRWSNPGSWDDMDFSTSFLRRPEWDYHPTGKLAFEFERHYLWGMSPRRSFRDAKIQRLETMATDIAVGMAVLAAAMKEDRLRREEEARRREEERQRRELVLRAQHIHERRAGALDKLLYELAALDRLRRLMATLRQALGASELGRMREFITFAEDQLARREAALSAPELERRFAENHLFGEDDDHDFRPPRSY